MSCLFISAPCQARTTMASSYFRPVVLLTALISLAQSIAWFVMSLLGILAYRCNLVPDSSSSKTSQLMYFLYFQGPQCDLQFTPENDWNALRKIVYAEPLYVNGWMCSYLTFDITYFILAISLLIEYCQSSKGSYSLTIVRLWCINTLAFLIMDLWLTIVWGLDFGYVQSNLDESKEGNNLGWMSTVPGALMAVTARGFILYIINFILFCYFTFISFNWRLLCSVQCTQVQEDNTGSRQHLHHKSYTDRDLMYATQHSIPRVHPGWVDNGNSLVPVDPAKWQESSRDTVVHHPNAVEGVTSFNDWYGVPSRQPKRPWSEDLRQEKASLGRSRPASPARPRQNEEIFQGRPSVRSTFEYPDRKNFEQGGNSKPVARPLTAAARNNDHYY